MNPSLKDLMTRYFAPAGEEGSDASGADTGAVVDMDDDAYMALPEAERRRMRGDEAESELQAPAQEPAEQEPASQAKQPDDVEEERGGSGIPRARFNEVNAKRKALEEENEALRARLAEREATPAASAVQAPAQPGLSIEQAEEQYVQYMLEGDTKAAAALRVQINSAIEEKALARFQRTTASEKAEMESTATISEMLTKFPWLDAPEGAEALELIAASVDAKMQAGQSRANAIRHAVQLIAPRFAPDAGRSQAEQPDTRSQRANERGATHSMQQPALPLAGMGNRATPATQDTSKLTDDEYYALPEEERKKARGDY